MTANIFACKDGILRVHMIAHEEDVKKSDAFLLEYNGVCILIDGGLGVSGATLRYLLDIRRAMLSEHAELLDDISCRLRIHVMVSHFHNDHVAALYTGIFCSPDIEVETLYLPPDSELHASYGPNGDRASTARRLPRRWEAISRKRGSSRMALGQRTASLFPWYPRTPLLPLSLSARPLSTTARMKWWRG